MTASTRLLVLLNPHAGRGAAAAAWAAAEPILRAAGCTPQLVETKWPGQARELLAALPRGACDAVVVAGGDGSLHEAINGLMAADTSRRPNCATGSFQDSSSWRGRAAANEAGKAGA